MRQCQLLRISRSSLYYQPKEASELEVKLLRRLDELYLKTPCYGSRRMTEQLKQEGYAVNRKRVQRLMRKLGLQAIYPKPRLSRANPEHKVYPYLLRNVAIESVNQVWSTDITYLPVLKGHFYLVAIMDWYSRKVLAWRLSNSMDADFCVEALKEAIAKHCTPEIFNSDQGSQFTSGAWIDVLVDAKIKISMDGKGAWRDNRMIERLWRSLKYECVYLNAFETGSGMRAGIGRWLNYYNDERPHSTHGLLTPNEAYASKTEPMRIAA